MKFKESAKEIHNLIDEVNELVSTLVNVQNIRIIYNVELVPTSDNKDRTDPFMYFPYIHLQITKVI